MLRPILGTAFALTVLASLSVACDDSDSGTATPIADGGSMSDAGGDAGAHVLSFKPSLVADALEAAWRAGDLDGVTDYTIDGTCGANPVASLRNGEGSICGATGTAKFLYITQPGGVTAPTGRLPYTIDAPTGNAPPMLVVAVAKNIRVTSQVVARGGAALVLVALDTLTIDGTIDVGGSTDSNEIGAGSTARADATSTKAPGVGGGVNAARDVLRSASGGSFCGVGGQSLATGSNSAPAPYGTPELVPLVAGSDGGRGVGKGGLAGGAVALIAGTSVTINGTVTAPGGGADRGDYGAGGTPGLGGGSGGAILLEAPTVTITGAVAANGGGGSDPGTLAGARGTNGRTKTTAAGVGGPGSGGTDIDGANGGTTTIGATSLNGGGGGGAGRIRVNAATRNVTGEVSPALTTTCGTAGALAAW